MLPLPSCMPRLSLSAAPPTLTHLFTSYPPDSLFVRSTQPHDPAFSGKAEAAATTESDCDATKPEAAFDFKLASSAMR